MTNASPFIPEGRNLIYFVVYGNPMFRECVALSIRSVRRGGFDGDVVVLSDRAFECGQADEVVVIPGKIPLKWDLELYVNIEEYDKVLFLDSDIIAVGDVNLLFESCCEKMVLPLQPGAIGYSEMHSKYLSAGELRNKRIRKAPPINAGTFCASSRRVKQYLSRWKTEWEKIGEICDLSMESGQSKKRVFCQPALQALVARNQIEVGYFPEGSIVFPLLVGCSGRAKVLSERTRLIHFCADPGKFSLGRILEIMRSIDRDPSFGGVEEALNRIEEVEE